MPLPKEPYTIEGGCNCKAVRYRISIPTFSERPHYPAGGPSKDIRMPVICTDHCNDCRSATGSILPFWILTPMTMVTVSCVDAASINKDGRIPGDTARGAWLAAAETFTPISANASMTLSFFASSKNRRRSFCARCGTMLAYQIFPLPEKWPSDWPIMLDIVLGTIDRQYLEDGDNLAPETQLWWECGVDWIRKFAIEKNSHLPIHPKYKVDEEISCGVAGDTQT